MGKFTYLRLLPSIRFGSRPQPFSTILILLRNLLHVPSGDICWRNSGTWLPAKISSSLFSRTGVITNQVPRPRHVPEKRGKRIAIVWDFERRNASNPSDSFCTGFIEVFLLVPTGFSHFMLSSKVGTII